MERTELSPEGLAAQPKTIDNNVGCGETGLQPRGKGMEPKTPGWKSVGQPEGGQGCSHRAFVLCWLVSSQSSELAAGSREPPFFLKL